MTHRKYLKEKKKIVVKVGTSLLAYDNAWRNWSGCWPTCITAERR